MMNLGLEALRSDNYNRGIDNMLSMEYIGAMMEINRQTCDLLLVVDKFENIADAFCNLVAVNNTVRRYGYTSSIEHMVGGNFRGGFSLEASEGASLNAFEKAWRWLKEMWRRFCSWVKSIFVTDKALVKKATDLADNLRKSKGLHETFMCSKNFINPAFKGDVSKLASIIKEAASEGSNDIERAIKYVDSAMDNASTMKDNTQRLDEVYEHKLISIAQKGGPIDTLLNNRDAGYVEVKSSDYEKVANTIDAIIEAFEGLKTALSMFETLQRVLDTQESRLIAQYKRHVVSEYGSKRKVDYVVEDDQGNKIHKDANNSGVKKSQKNAALDSAVSEAIRDAKVAASGTVKVITKSISYVRRLLHYVVSSIKANKATEADEKRYNKGTHF